MSRLHLRRGLEAALTFVLLWTLPAWWCARQARERFALDRATHRPLAQGVVARANLIGQGHHSTGHDLYDAEWELVACQMTTLGLGQLSLKYPALAPEYLPAIERCLRWMTTPEALAFGARRWKQTPEQALQRGHAYLGYLNMALGMHRILKPTSEFNALHDRLSQALIARLKEPFYKLETYPGEVYPADLSTVAGSIALYDKSAGQDHSRELSAWLGGWQKAIHKGSGLLYQSLDPNTGQAVDKPRASGTAFSVYFLSFAKPKLSQELWRSLKSCCFVKVAGFGGIQEYPAGVPGGWGDVDSGPVLFGVGPSASAFAIAGASLMEDEEVFVSLMRTATLFGAPVSVANQQRYLMGGALGDALLLAMTTARASRKLWEKP